MNNNRTIHPFAAHRRLQLQVFVEPLDALLERTLLASLHLGIGLPPSTDQHRPLTQAGDHRTHQVASDGEAVRASFPICPLVPRIVLAAV